MGWIRKLFVARLRHEEVKNAEGDSRDRRQKEKARVETRVMHDGTGNDLAERSANPDRRADRPKGEIKTARALREIGDHED